jgi:uncharacterized protein (TIGR00106 family)
MSVLLDFSIFPTDQGVSVSAFVAPVVALFRDSGHPCRLTPMGTIVETDTLPEALDLIARAHALLEERGCGRVYATARFDIRSGASGRLTGKIASVRGHIGEVPE